MNWMNEFRKKMICDVQISNQGELKPSTELGVLGRLGLPGSGRDTDLQ